MNRAAAVGLSALVVVLLAGCAHLAPASSGSNEAPRNDVTTPPAQPGSSINNAAPAGSAVALTGPEGSYSIKFGAPIFDASATIAAANEFNPAPESGLQYLIVPVTLQNTGTSNIDAGLATYSGISIVVNGSTYQKAPFAVLPNDLGSVHAVAPGTSATGNLAFEVPTGTVQGTWVVTAGSSAEFIAAK